MEHAQTHTHAQTPEIKLEAHQHTHLFTHLESNGTMPTNHIISYSTVKQQARERRRAIVCRGDCSV